MLVTVVSSLGEASSAVALTELGCTVRQCRAVAPPTEIVEQSVLVFIEAADDGDLGRYVISRVRSVDHEVPVILAVQCDQLGRVEPRWGHDDFIVMPYSPQELYARLRAAEWRISDFTQSERIKIGNVIIEPAAHSVQVHGRDIEMPQREYQLLLMLVQARGRVQTRASILSRLWGARGGTDGPGRSLDVHVRRLRERLSGWLRIETVRGVGYKIIG